MMWINTVSDKEGILNPEETEKLKPELLCVDADGWFQIKTGWLEACRYLQEDCTAQIESVQDIVDELNAKAKSVLEGLGEKSNPWPPQRLYGRLSVPQPL